MPPRSGLTARQVKEVKNVSLAVPKCLLLFTGKGAWRDLHRCCEKARHRSAGGQHRTGPRRKTRKGEGVHVARKNKMIIQCTSLKLPGWRRSASRRCLRTQPVGEDKQLFGRRPEGLHFLLGGTALVRNADARDNLLGACQ